MRTFRPIRRRRPARPAHLHTTGRLATLRFRLALLLTALNVVGLAGMGAVALAVDRDQRAGLVRAELDRTARTTKALLAYESGALSVDRLYADPASTGPTAVFVYEGTRTGPRLVFAHPAALPVIAPAVLRGLARDGGERATTVTAAGRDARLLAVPFPHAVTGAVAGTIVVGTDLGPVQDAHRRLGWTLFAGGTVFTALAGLGGLLLARRGTRPALEAIGQQERFVADAAHELRTPLTVIRTQAESALKDPERQAQALRQVVRSAERLGDSVEALLLRARLVAGLREVRREPFRLDQLAEEVVAENVQPPHTALVSTEPTVAHGDPVLVRIALRNLVHNAVRHGRTGTGPAVVTLDVRDGEVRIGDRGPGPGDRPVRRFGTGAPDGTGLGLSIAGWVAELHDGTLRLDRAPAGGTRATLTLPTPPPSA
ncbi:two-component sensor histidine kinase [Sphaerisporangium rufum]|uniref:histidine kinase n=1 Tax=Sphaerisporangium rufum TaxID=1381558 RepID=A0A919V1Q8_9ACTN|nr:HAMP domain-containing sensor histidine kinase [Sphaerisporangium rufum]GII78118.1 two-component sensor histidine kinase [Sphaerisporangium rufum]